ncbi:MAG: GTP-binding protein [Oscillospiraceae bacterium]
MIALDIISGFLGAGKTTLINKLLAEAYIGERPVLIENEFGDVGVDDSLIENPEVQVRLLASGCICCTLISGFVQGITEVAQKYHPSRIIVEPTGLANPEAVLTACAEAAKNVPLEVKTLITVANATNVIPLLAVGGELFHQQLAGAEIIVLSCTQLLSRQELADVKLAIRELNPHSLILDQDWKELDALSLLSLAEEARARKTGKAGPAGVPHHSQAHDDHHGHHHDHEHSTDGYVSMAFFPERTFSEKQAQALLAALSNGDYGDILRAKGFLCKPGGGFSRVEYVYGRGELLGITYNGQPKFVVIGKAMNEEKLSELMEQA